MIRFIYECWPPYGDVDVFAESDGSDLAIFHDEVEIPFEDIAPSDQSRIKATVKEWVDHYKIMEQASPDPHTCGYVRELNKGR